MPLVRVDPEYPPGARQRRIEGYVDLEFTIGPVGTVEDPKVIAANPPAVFEELRCGPRKRSCRFGTRPGYASTSPSSTRGSSSGQTAGCATPRIRIRPGTTWLRLLAALLAQREDFESATPVLEELVLRFPKQQYWMQLALIYGAREDYPRSLAVQQVAYAQGLMTADGDLRRLARSYLYNGLPYPAAKVLEKALEVGRIERDPESLELLANSWIAAREYERSLPPLEEAAALSQDGNLEVRLGQVYMQREEWSEAVGRLESAVRKGGLEDPGNAELLLGISYYNDARVARARSSFVRARSYDSTREEASRWIGHLESGTGPG